MNDVDVDVDVGWQTVMSMQNNKVPGPSCDKVIKMILIQFPGGYEIVIEYKDDKGTPPITMASVFYL